MENDSIKLTPVERQSFINQFRILQQLADDEYVKKDYERKIEALSSGYELHYQDVLEDVQENTLTAEQCREILDILEMFRGIIYSFIALEREQKLTDLNRSQVRFAGFDGNNECEAMCYVKYFIKDLDRYSEIQEFAGPYFDYNSHFPMMSTYRDMLIKWNQYRQTLQNAYLMNEAQIKELLKNYHPMF